MSEYRLFDRERKQYILKILSSMLTDERTFTMCPKTQP